MVVFGVALAAQLLILIVGVVFHVVNKRRCNQGKRPIGYGPNATCNDISTNEDLFYRHPKHPMPVVQRVSRPEGVQRRRS